MKLMSAKVKKAELESKGLLEKATTQKIIEWKDNINIFLLFLCNQSINSLWYFKS